MGASIAKIVLAGLVVIAIYNIVSSGNSAGIISKSSGGAAQVIHALEGK